LCRHNVLAFSRRGFQGVCAPLHHTRGKGRKAEWNVAALHADMICEVHKLHIIMHTMDESSKSSAYISSSSASARRRTHAGSRNACAGGANVWGQ